MLLQSFDTLRGESTDAPEDVKPIRRRFNRVRRRRKIAAASSGFGLSDEDALAVLTDWNTRCEPPWTQRQLLDKVARARKYGCEPIGGLR